MNNRPLVALIIFAITLVGLAYAYTYYKICENHRELERIWLQTRVQLPKLDERFA